MFIKGLNPAVTVKKYCVGEIEMNYCYGCKKCYESGECVQNDGVKNVVSDILSSDYVVIAAPSWWADVPAQLKTLFDRTTPYGDTNPNRKYKAEKPVKGIAIAVRAGVRQAENALILNSIEHYFGHLGIETVERISITETNTPEDLISKNGDKTDILYNLGKSLGEKNNLSGIRLLRANADDAELIWTMQKIAFAELLEKYGDYQTSPANEPLEKTVKRLNSPSTYYYFICVDGENVGAIRVIDKKCGENKRISPIFIMPAYRGKGYAYAAIRAVEAIHGANRWELDTILQEEGNCRLYERAGYRKTDKMQRVNDKMTLVFYEK